MTHKLTLGFYLQKGSITINDASQLNEEGNRILELVKSADDHKFKECCELLQENLSVMFITSNVYELEDIFDGDDEEIDADEVKVVKIFKAEGDEICFSAEGSVTIQVSKAINTEDELRQIEEELDGSFDNGLAIHVPIFNENEDDPFAEANDGDGDMISSWEGLAVSVIN
jgi:hypothetical protein